MVHAAVEAGVNLLLRIATHAKEMQLPLHDAPVLQVQSGLGSMLALATVAAVLVVSQLTYSWIEEPWRDWSKTAWQKLAWMLGRDRGPSSS